ncbi:MAG: glycosyltransferase family 1 protein [bacterium]|nr:glycosyltransferase family 1 protein [bacterium]
MHIAFNAWFWNQPYTGSGQYLRRLVGALRKIAPDLRITLVMPPGITPQADELPANVEVYPTRGTRSNLGKVWFEQRTYPAAAAALKADIAHVPYWGAPLTSPARLVTSVLDVIPLVMPEYAPTLQAKLYTSLVTASARGSGHVITISQAAKADIVRHIGLPAESITVTYLAADDRFHPRLGAEQDAAVKAKYTLPDNYVLYLGGFDVRKRVLLLLEAYAYVAKAEGEEYPLVIAGREPDWDDPLFPNVREAAKTLGIDHVLHWVEAPTDDEKPSLYRMARVFVFPSAYEGFGLPVIEAMACGTPVIAQDAPGISEIVGDAAYLTRRDDARSMGGALLALLGQDPLRETQISRGLGQATQYSWRKTARDTLNVYERIMKTEV